MRSKDTARKPPGAESEKLQGIREWKTTRRGGCLCAEGITQARWRERVECVARFYYRAADEIYMGKYKVSSECLEGELTSWGNLMNG